jgi:hypothetical protein
MEPQRRMAWPGGEIARAVPAPAQRPPRTITQLCGTSENLYALCSDGSVWQLLAGMWLPEPGIPQRQVGGEE